MSEDFFLCILWKRNPKVADNNTCDQNYQVMINKSNAYDG